jgi:hypothetical protein
VSIATSYRPVGRNDPFATVLVVKCSAKFELQIIRLAGTGADHGV